jgi:large subunit ribosomal protein L4
MGSDGSLRIPLDRFQQVSLSKTRGEVSGGGKKPWKQKGTGRARTGSTRNPIWRHGGIAHGPKPTDWSLEMPKKMKQKALVVALSQKLKEEKFTLVSALDLAAPKTKEFTAVLKNLKLTGNCLVVLPVASESIERTTRNLKKVNIKLVDTLNAYDLVSSNNVVFLKDSAIKLQEKYEN